MSILSINMHRIFQLFIELERTPSTNEKKELIDSYLVNGAISEADFKYCLEVLDGRHKLGYKLSGSGFIQTYEHDLPNVSLEEFCKPLFELKSKDDASIYKIEQQFKSTLWFLAPLFNRDWRLGIGQSLLEKTDTSPMLAKKFEPEKLPYDDTYYVTQKLDGNRCITKYNFETNKWEHYSRSGKLMNVSFDMDVYDKNYVYDGEILSRDQIYNPSQANFNSLSGVVNSKYGNKDSLVYVIFDIVVDKISYGERRLSLTFIDKTCVGSKNVQILPVLAIKNRKELLADIYDLLESITSRGGEGVMINLGSRYYQHKRTDALLKVKEVYTMDMKVGGFELGTGKYADAIGSLQCVAVDGKTVYVSSVGSGLSECQRFRWAQHPEEIIGKIVEVAYFSLSQDKNSRGTNYWSLRFPRFKRIRDDKTDTSVD